MKIFLVIMVLVIVLMAGGLFVLAPTLGGGDGEGGGLFAMSASRSGTDVRMEAVVRRDLIETIPAPGLIEPHTQIDISSQVVAEITALPFREGDDVSKNDLVVQLDDRDLRARLESAEASLASANASLQATKASRDRTGSSLEELQNRRSGLVTTLDFAQKNLERKQELYDSGDIPMAQLDQALERVRDVETQIAAMDSSISGAESSLAQAEADILRAEASVKQAEAEIKLVEEGLRNTKILSPIDGKVVALNAEVGETVITGTMNNPGTVIMSIADLSRMRMIARVDESRIDPVREQQIARVHINSYRDTVFRGVVDRIALQMTRQPDGTGFFETEILLTLEGNEIYSGGNANAEIEVASHHGLVVPSQAIVERDIEDLPDAVVNNPLVDRTKRIIQVAYRVVDGKAMATPVRVGASDLTHTLVLEGLDQGDIVVTGPYKVLDKIKHDEAVVDINNSDSGDDDVDATHENADAADDNGTTQPAAE